MEADAKHFLSRGLVDGKWNGSIGCEIGRDFQEILKESWIRVFKVPYYEIFRFEVGESRLPGSIQLYIRLGLLIRTFFRHVGNSDRHAQCF